MSSCVSLKGENLEDTRAMCYKYGVRELPVSVIASSRRIYKLL